MANRPSKEVANSVRKSFKKAIESFQERLLDKPIFQHGNQPYVQSLMERLNKNWEGYKRMGDTLTDIMHEENIDIIEIDAVVEMELDRLAKIYADCKEIIEQRLKALTIGVNMPPPRPAEVQLPEFKGMYYEYIVFRQAVQKRVLDADYPPHTKIDLIVNALRDDARRYVGPVQGQDQPELDRIWKVLESTYFNPYLLTRAHIGRIFDLPRISSPSVDRYRQVITVVRQHLHALGELGLLVQHWDAVVIEALLRKLDDNGLEAWETARKSTEIPKLDCFLEFLESRIIIIGNININQPATSKRTDHQSAVSQSDKHNRDSRHEGSTGHPLKNGKRDRSNNDRDQHKRHRSSGEKRTQHGSNGLAPPHEQCLLKCKNKVPHYLWLCKTFRSFDLQQRVKFIEEQGLCKRCVTAKHPVDNCTVRKCNDCDGEVHNTILCPRYMVVAKVNTVRSSNNHKKKN